ncbi:MAG: hypothetical protein HN995_02095 [Candidatus Marinimicrobia bacterium]|jgi:hypothetical protein|nr:hypothetical protein [Candidatus Neomarinimicrobiota bacterium]MBT3576498.1 hypothetical protein [Candidatus Neomarinimicrobiota bacterium]MBT3681284.1 hypothetical protein [Candidatus Neomarinimicrobiota bacterium]MBT3951498.1 hypothetical protein [Candidatus Neomarinimicrobiota bacterium]MBT4253890.1 hypothetical protein [Candidatus Neomarinimicrobiota bacterium]
MHLSYQEKSIWASLIITSIMFIYYFSRVLGVIENPEIPETSLIIVFIGVITVTIFAQIVIQSIMAIIYRDEVKDGGDERETLIRLKATSISHYVLISGVWIACMSFYLNPSALMLMNVFIVFFVVSEIVGFVTQLIYYQRGV